MTTITYCDGGLTIEGHSGKSVVCHGISAIAQMIANFVEDNQWGSVVRGDAKIEIKNVNERYYGNELFRAMAAAFEDIRGEFPDYVKIIRN